MISEEKPGALDAYRAGPPAAGAAAARARPHGEPGVTDVHLKDVLGTLGRRWPTVAVTFGLVVGAVALYSFLAPPVWRAKAVLYMETEELSAGTFTAELATAARKDLFSRAQFYKTERDLLRSRSLARKIVDRKDLWDRCGGERWGLGGSDPIARFLAAVDVEGEPSSKLTTVFVDHHDAQCAADLANALAATYREENLQAIRDKYSADVTELLPQLEGLRHEVADSFEKAQAAKGRLSLLSIDETDNEQSRKVAELGVALTRAEVERIAVEKRYEQARRFAKTPAQLEALPEVLQSAPLQRLRAALVAKKAEISDLSERYREKHPVMQRARAQLVEVEKQVADELGTVVESLRHDYQRAAEVEDSIRRQFENQKEEAMAVSSQTGEAVLLRQEARAKQIMLDTLTPKIVEASIVARIKTNNVRVVDPAEPPSAPSYPNRPLFLLVGAALGLVFGVALAFVREMLDETVRTRGDAERASGLGVLGVVPAAGGPGSAESARRLLALIALARERTELASFVFSGVAGEEGVSWLVAAVGRCAADSGRRVLILDACLAERGVTRALRLEGGPGLLEWLSGEASLPQVARPIPNAGPNLSLVGPGSAAARNGSVGLLAEPGRIRAALEEAAHSSDLILIGAPPVLDSSEAMLLAGVARATILVCRLDHARAGELAEAVRNLEQAGAGILGLVLTEG